VCLGLHFDRSKDLHRPCPSMGHRFNHLLLCRRTPAVHIVRARIDGSGVVVVFVQNVQLPLLTVLYFEDGRLKGHPVARVLVFSFFALDW
jgi:hypothetical protein